MPSRLDLLSASTVIVCDSGDSTVLARFPCVVDATTNPSLVATAAASGSAAVAPLLDASLAAVKAACLPREERMPALLDEIAVRLGAAILAKLPPTGLVSTEVDARCVFFSII